MRQITKQEFLSGYEEGYITEVVAIGTRVYGRDPRGQGETEKGYEVVYTDV